MFVPVRFPALVVVALSMAAPAAADVTVTTTTTIAGGAAAMGAEQVSPKVVTRVSGPRSRTDVTLGEQVVTTILDSAAREGYLLRADEKTAMWFSLDGAPAAPAAEGAHGAVQSEVKPTGGTRQVEGVPCDEYSVSMRMDLATLASAGGSTLPPEAAAMLKDVVLRLTGSTCVAKTAPGASEYIAFQKASGGAAGAALARATAAAGGPAGTALPSGMEGLVTGFPQAEGIPYLTELTSTMEGSGQLVALMQKMGQMTITSRVNLVATDAIPADVFKVPEGYKLLK